MGFTHDALSTHKVNVGFSVFRIILAIIVVALSVSVVSDLENSINLSGGLTSSDEEVNDSIQTLFKILKGFASVAGVAVLITDGIGLLSYFIWSKGLNIFYIVAASLIIVVLFVCGLLAAIPAGGISTQCSYLDRECVPCDLSETLCDAKALAAGKDCYYRTDAYQTVCVDIGDKLNAVVAILFILAVLEFIGAIMGCCGCEHIGHSHYDPVMVVHHHHGAPQTQTAYFQVPQ